MSHTRDYETDIGNVKRSIDATFKRRKPGPVKRMLVAMNEIAKPYDKLARILEIAEQQLLKHDVYKFDGHYDYTLPEAKKYLEEDRGKFYHAVATELTNKLNIKKWYTDHVKEVKSTQEEQERKRQKEEREELGRPVAPDAIAPPDAAPAAQGRPLKWGDVIPDIDIKSDPVAPPPPAALPPSAPIEPEDTVVIHPVEPDEHNPDDYQEPHPGEQHKVSESDHAPLSAGELRPGFFENRKNVQNPERSTPSVDKEPSSRSKNPGKI